MSYGVETVDGKEVKVRLCKKCGASLEVKPAKAKAAAKKTRRTTKKTAKKAESEE